MKAILIILGVIIIGSLLMPSDKPSQTVNQKMLSDLFNQNLDGIPNNVRRAIKDKLKDPDSFEHIKCTYQVMPDTSAVLLKETFRSKNSFNGFVVNTAVVEVDIYGNITNFAGIE